MSVLFDGKPCLSPADLPPHVKAALRGPVNLYDCPLGCRPGYATLVVLRWHLNQLTFDLPQGSKYKKLEMFDSNNVKLTFKNFVPVGQPVALDPGAPGDETTPYLLRVADQRWLHWERGDKANKAYNVRSSADGAYYSGTLNAGTAWTWAQILSDLWPSGMGTVPSLPFSPSGTPEGFWYEGIAKWQAVEDFLNRLCCKVKYNPVTATCTIVRLGTDATVDDYLTKFERVRVWDNYPMTPRIAAWPETLRVQFRVRPPYSDGTSPVYSVDQTVTTYPAVFQADGTVAVIDDDLYAQQSGGTVSNSSALTTRATERRTDWERKRRYFDTAEVRSYAGCLNLLTALGGKWGRLCWHDSERGFTTTLAAGVADDADVWHARHYFPEVINGNMDIRSYRAPARWHPADCVGHQHEDFAGNLSGRYGWTEAYLLAMAYTSRVILVPFVLPVTASLTKIGTQAYNKMATTRHVRLGLYKASNYPTDAYARTLVVDAGDVSVATGFSNLQPTVSTTLSPGLYWIAMGMPSDNMGGDATDQVNTGVAINSTNPFDTYSPYRREWPVGVIRRVNPAPLGSNLPGIFSGTLGYHMAYPNAAASTATQGTLPSTLDAPTDIDGGANSLFLLPVLSLYLSSVTSAGGSGGAAGSSLPPADASYVVLAANSSLSAERVLTQGTDITITDGGANSTVTIAAAADRDVDGGTW